MQPPRPFMRQCRTLLVALLTLVTTVTAQQPEASTVDDATLDALTKDATQARDATLAGALQTLDKASASPKAAEEFFFDCVKTYDFKRDLDVGTKFDDWRRAFAEQWRGHDLGFVLQLQLRHQALVLRSAGTADKAVLTTQWLALAESIVTRAEDAMFGASFLAQPITTSVFDKALKLRQLTGNTHDFGAGPLDIGGIFDTHIHPHVPPENRKGAWERRLQLQTEFAKKTLLSTEREDFENFELPRLRWRQLLDVRFHDGTPQDSSAWDEAATFIRQHIKHPDASDWVDKLRELRSKARATP